MPQQEQLIENIMEDLEDFYNEDDRIIEIGKFQLKCLLEKHLKQPQEEKVVEM